MHKVLQILTYKRQRSEDVIGHWAVAAQNRGESKIRIFLSRVCK
jgi:hypothetical protein